MIGIIVLTLTAFILSIVLVFVDNFLNKNDNKNKEEIMSLLPGYNCGACGFGSCEGMCNAMIKDLNNYKKCKPLRGESLKNMEDYVNKNIDNNNKMN